MTTIISYSDEDLNLEYYLANHLKEVTKKVRKQKKSWGVIDLDVRITFYEKQLASAFWSEVKEAIQEKAKLSRLQVRIKRIRQLERKQNEQKMCIDPRTGEIRSFKWTTYYYEEDPLLGPSEREPKKRRLSEPVWDVHRSLCPRIPYLTIGFCNKEIGDYFMRLDQRVALYLKKFNVKPRGGRNHKGFSFASRVVGGRQYGNGQSGSVHWSDYFKFNPPLQLELVYALRDVIVSAFGDCEWFNYLNMFLRTHPNRLFRDRLLPALPVTHIRMSIGNTPVNSRRDHGHFGVAFFLVPYTVEGEELAVTDPDFEVARANHIQKYMVLAGRCFHNEHFYLAKIGRRQSKSYSLYPDFRMECAGYVRRGYFSFKT